VIEEVHIDNYNGNPSSVFGTIILDLDMPQALDYSIEAIQLKDKDWIRQLITQRWGADFVVSRSQIHRPDELPGFLAIDGTERIGLITYYIEGDECEIVSLVSLRPGFGIGTELMNTVANTAVQAGCRRLFLITTNDNLDALGFYQRRGLELVAVYRNALAETRRLKPQLPMIGLNKIPLRDELELELILS
jgi:N-acetylglutamate synthase-like GNAT family acetyltransferase